MQISYSVCIVASDLGIYASFMSHFSTLAFRKTTQGQQIKSLKVPAGALAPQNVVHNFC